MDELIAVQRLRVPADQAAAMRVAVGELTAYWDGLDSCVDHALARNLDEPDLWLLWSRWVNVGSYRRALGGPGKYLWLPVMGWVIDEPTAYGYGGDEPQIVHYP